MQQNHGLMFDIILGTKNFSQLQVYIDNIFTIEKWKQ